MPGMLAWGLVAGVAMVKGGLSVPNALLMSLLVYSAGAQLGAVALMATGAPFWVILATTFCVNLRFVIFSAALRPFLMPLARWQRALLGYMTADLSYVLFIERYGKAAGPGPGQIPYLVGCCAINWLCWHVASVLGIVFAGSFPSEWGLGFAGVLALVGLCCTLLRDVSSAVSATAAFVVTLAARGLPLRLNIVVAICVSMAVGVLCDRAAELRAEAVRT